MSERKGMPAVERTARDLCVLCDWYTERPSGLTYRELGERYGMSESGACHLVKNHRNRGWFAHLLWPVMAQRIMVHKEAWGSLGAMGIKDVGRMLEGRLSWSQDLMNMADDRLMLARVRGS